MSAVPVPGLRALVALVSAVVLGDTIFYSAVTPLLPTYADDLDLGKTGAGVLEASYAAGTLAAAIPAGLLAARVGVRRTVLVGLGLLGLSSLAFGIAGSIVLLDVARFAQGVGGACSWAGALAWLVRRAPPERRGELIGAAMGAAIVGALLGPAVGAAAHAIGTGPVFGAAAILAAALAAWTLRVPSPPPGPVPPARTLVYAARDARVAGGMALVSLPGLLFAGVGVLGPLRLDDVGASAAGIGAVFLIGSGFEAATSPVVGRLSDRLGRLAPIRAGLLLAAPLLVLVPHPGVAWGVGALIVLVSPAIGASWAPAMALMSDGAEARGVDPALGFALVNAAWGVGHVVGGAGAGALGDAFGDPVAFAALGGVSLAVAALLARPRVDGALRAKEAST